MYGAEIPFGAVIPTPDSILPETVLRTFNSEQSFLLQTIFRLNCVAGIPFGLVIPTANWTLAKLACGDSIWSSYFHASMNIAKS